MDKATRLLFLAVAVVLGLAMAAGAFQDLPAHAQTPVPGVTVSETSLEIEEGNSDTYDVELDAMPTGDVTVTIGGIMGTDLILDKSSLTFTDQNWNTRQTVTVSATADDDATHDRATLTHAASGGGYDSVSTDLPVTVTDITRMRLVAVVDKRVLEGESKPIRALLPMPLDEDVTISVAVVQTRGRADQYVLSANTRLTIAAGATESTGEVIFTSLDDFENEVSRSFDATLTPDHPRVDEDTESFSVIEDDHTIVDLEVAPWTIFENGGEARLRALKYRLHEGVVKMAVSLEPSGRATLRSTTLTFEPGSVYSTETLTITAVDNAADEPDQTITISATVTEGRGVWTPLPLKLTVVDDDNMSPEVALVLTPLHVREGLVSTVTAVANGPLGDEATITVSASPGHTDTRTDDFVLSANTVLTIPVGGTRSTGTVTIATVDDMLGGGVNNPFSGRGRSREVMVSGTVTGGGGVADPADQTLTILDDDRPVLAALVATPATISEGEDSEVSTITLRAFQPVPADMIVTVQQGYESDAAELSENRVLMIAAGETESTGVVTLTARQDDDKTHEVVGVRARTSGDNQFVKVQYYVDVFIIDDDIENAWVMVSPVPARMYEGETSTVIAKLSQTLPDDVTITIGFDESHPDHTATEDDFTLSANRTLTIPAGSMSSTGLVTLTASDDEYYGPGQSRKIIMDVSATGIDQSKVGKHSDWVIRDDESTPQVTLAVAPASIAESDGQSTVTASLNTIVEGDVVVTVATALDVAAKPDDFTQSGTLLTIPAGQKNSTGNVTISAVNDDDDGPDKHLVVTGTAEVMGMEESGLVWFPHPEGLTITDDDAPSSLTVNFKESGYSVTEGSIEEIVLTLDDDPERTVTIPLSWSNKDGASDSDHNGVPTDVTFNAGETEKSFEFSAVSDRIGDPGEKVSINLGDLPSGVTKGTPSETVVTIGDVDLQGSTTVSFGADTYGVSEGSFTTITVVMSHAPGSDAIIPIQRTNQGASDSDYSGVHTSVTFGPTDTEKTITFTATDDAEDDDGESVDLTFVNLPTGVSTGSPSTTTVTITDNDVSSVSVSKTELTVTEQDTTGDNYMVVLGSRPSASVTVTVAGYSGTDATPNPDSLTFTTSNWHIPQEVTVTAGNDADTTTDLVTLTHSAVSTDTRYSGISIASLTVTVNDNDTANTAPTFSVSTQTREVPENTGANVNIGDALPAATDADGDTLTYSLGGTDAASFTLNIVSRQLKTKSGVSYDFEAKPRYSVMLEVSDDRGGTASLAVAVNITDVDEPTGESEKPPQIYIYFTEKYGENKPLDDNAQNTIRADCSVEKYFRAFWTDPNDPPADEWVESYRIFRIGANRGSSTETMEELTGEIEVLQTKFRYTRGIKRYPELIGKVRLHSEGNRYVSFSFKVKGRYGDAWSAESRPTLLSCSQVDDTNQ